MLNLFRSSQGNFAPEYYVHLIALFAKKLNLFAGLNHLVSQKFAQVIQVVSVQIFFSFCHVVLKVGHLCKNIS